MTENVFSSIACDKSHSEDLALDVKVLPSSGST